MIILEMFLGAVLVCVIGVLGYVAYRIIERNFH